jgi:hypothetical protein
MGDNIRTETDHPESPADPEVTPIPTELMTISAELRALATRLECCLVRAADVVRKARRNAVEKNDI